MQSNYLDDLLAGLRPGGCVQSYLRDFAVELTSTGYSRLSTRDFVRSAAHLGRWMDGCGFAVDKITDEMVSAFGQHRCKCPGASPHHKPLTLSYVRRVRKFVDYLRRIGSLPQAAPPVAVAVPAPLVEFRAWMRNHRGVTDRTIDRYEQALERILPLLGEDPNSYDAALVRRTLLEVVRNLNRVYAKTFVTALRAFLRFLAAEGRCGSFLHRAVPTVPDWTLSELPRYLGPEDVDRVIASCELSKPHGIRDRAVLSLLARLGLRAGDIVSMRLDDIDWHSGTLRVCGKGRKEVSLPMPQESGDALLEYLVKARPTGDSQRVFLCTRAPIRPFAGASTVSSIVRLALQRAGLTDTPSKGAHLLRHSAATAMLRSGASLDAVGAVLRHQSTDTTAYYAKVDIDLLQQVAEPWPEGTPC